MRAARCGRTPWPSCRRCSTPGIRSLVSRAPVPSTADKVRRLSEPALGKHAAGSQRREYFEVVRAAMAMPGWREAMASHLNLALKSGRPRAENLLGDDELARLAVPVGLIWGDDDY